MIQNPLNTRGLVKSVNNILPDANGNVNIDIPTLDSLGLQINSGDTVSLDYYITVGHITTSATVLQFIVYVGGIINATTITSISGNAIGRGVSGYVWGNADSVVQLEDVNYTYYIGKHYVRFQINNSAFINPTNNTCLEVYLTPINITFG